MSFVGAQATQRRVEQPELAATAIAGFVRTHHLSSRSAIRHYWLLLAESHLTRRLFTTSINKCLPILARNLEISTCGSKGKLGNDVEVFKLQPESDNLLAEGGEVVLVGFADLFDQAVKAESFQQS